MNNSIAIITDSTCDIPLNLIDYFGIRVIPQVLVWGTEILKDRVDISPEEFYARLKTDPVMPSSTLPSPSEFSQAYQDSIDNGAKEIIMLTVSSAMSGTYQMAQSIGEQMDVPVHVVDSKGPTMSLGWQVLAAAKIRELRGGVSAILAEVSRVREKLVQIVCLDTLEYLYRGGRIGGATRLIGSLLDLKPIVMVNHKTGLVESSGQTRTRKKSIELLFSRFVELVGKGSKKHVAVLHGNAPEEAKELVEKIKKEISPTELILNITGPVLGIHTGPRALALCGYSEE